MVNDLLSWKKIQIKEANRRYAPNGFCIRCGNPLAVSIDDFGIFCKRCGMVMK
jgi:hypothetical protein